MEAILKDQRRRRWSPAVKVALAKRTYEPGMSVSLVAQQEGVAPSLLFQWRKLEREGALVAVSADESVGLASELVAARAENTKLQRILGKKTLENEIHKEPVEYSVAKKLDCALTLVAQGRPVKPVCDSLRGARSHVNQRLHRPEQWVDGRTQRKWADNDGVIQEIRQHRRACAFVNRDRRAPGRPAVNAKRAYRVMVQAPLQRPKAPRLKQSRRQHRGKVAVPKSS